MLIAIGNVILLVAAFIFLHVLKRKQFQLSTRILISLVIGTLYGFLLKLTPENWLLSGLKDFLSLIGDAYLDLLKMLVIPLILTSIIHAILNLGAGNKEAIKRMSFLTCSILLMMTAIASLIGLLIGKLFAVGEGLTLPVIADVPSHVYTGLTDTLLGMFPTNPVAVMAQQNTIAIVVFAVLLGIAARTLDVKDHDKMMTFTQLIASLFAIVKKLATLVLRLTPYGVMALISLLLFTQGLAVLTGMLNFISAMYVAMFIVITLHSLLLLFVGVHPVYYFKRAITPLFVAFTTRSSFGTLPVTEETLHNKFNTSQVISTFVPSIGATIGMNACAGIFPAMLVVMTLTILHQPLTLHYVFMVMFINAIASLGISGIPGTAYIAATVTLTSLNLPYAIIALVQGIDPIVDMGRTATNVNGVMTTALLVDRMNGYGK